MRFDRVTLQNFLSHEHTTLLLGDRGLVLVTARNLDDPGANSNGGGKSSLVVDSILFALFGRTLMGLKGSEVVRRQAGKDCLVTLEGHDGERSFVIQRGQSCAEVPRPTLTAGEETVTGDAEVTKAVERMLGGIDFSTFASSLVFGQIRFFTQCTDAQRKQILEQLLGLEALTDFLERAKEALDGLDEQLLQVETEAGTVIAALAEVKDHISGLVPRAEQFEAMQKSEKARIEKALKEAQREQAQWLQEQDTQTKERERAEKAIQQSGQLLARASTALAEADTTRQEAVARVAALGSQRTAAESRHTRLHDLTAAKVCPTCEQAVGADVSWTQHLEEAETALDELDRELAAATETLAQEQAAWEAMLDAQRKAVSSKLTAEQTKTSATELAKRARATAEAISRQLNSLGAEKARILAMQNVAKQAIADATKRRKQLEARRETLQGRIVALKEERRYYLFWRDGFGNAGIKSHLLDRVVPQLNESARRYSNILTDGALQVTFNTQATLKSGETREQFSVEVSVLNEGVAYKTCSAGQRRRADILATLALGDLALRRVGHPINLLVLDEIFDGLDETGVERALQLLHHLSDERGRSSVFVISHNDQLAQHFACTETVIYENRTSRLEAAA